MFVFWQGERGPVGETGFPGPEGPHGIPVRTPAIDALMPLMGWHSSGGCLAPSGSGPPHNSLSLN